MAVSGREQSWCVLVGPFFFSNRANEAAVVVGGLLGCVIENSGDRIRLAKKKFSGTDGIKWNRFILINCAESV